MTIGGAFCLAAGILSAGVSVGVLTLGVMTGASNAVMQAGFVFVLGLLLAALGTKLRQREAA